MLRFIAFLMCLAVLAAGGGWVKLALGLFASVVVGLFAYAAWAACTVLLGSRGRG